MLERAVLAGVLMGDELPATLGLEERHFCDPLCRQLFTGLLQMQKDGQQIDLVSACMSNEHLDCVALTQIAQERPVSVVLLRQHCDELRDADLRRRLGAMIASAQTAIADGANVAESIAALSKAMEELVREDAENTQSGGTMLELMARVIEQIEKREEPADAIATGITKIDQCLCGGFRPGDLAVIAALTSVGKSAMLAFMMRNAAEQGRKILLISCEMSDEQNAERYIASTSGVPLDQIMRREALSEEQNRALCDGIARYHPENIRVISSGTQTVESVRREALRMKMGMGLDMVVVDYLQRVRPGRGGQNRADDVGAIAAGLKSMAVDLNVPVLTAAQFNREAAKARSDAQGNADAGVPALHQLRDSSQIEDEANTVIILDEPRRELRASLRYINAYVAKNRSGMLGAVRLVFNPQTMRYVAPEA